MGNEMTNRDQTKALIQRVKSAYQHPYLFSIIPHPAFDENRLALFLSLLKEKHSKHMETAVLMELALNTHELVATNAKTLKERQLTVLAGDYLSGVYYQSVSRLGDVTFLNRLSTAIKAVNESKIELKLQEASSLDQLLAMQSVIDDGMLVHVLEHFGFKKEREVVSKGLTLTRLEVELENWKKRSITPFLQNLQSIAKREKLDSILIMLEKEVARQQAIFQSFVQKYWSAPTELLEVLWQPKPQTYLAEEG